MGSALGGSGVMTIKMIHAELKVKNCSAEMYINGIPLRKRQAPDSLYFTMPIHEYLVDGVNKVWLVINPGPTPSESLTKKREMLSRGMGAEAQLVRYPIGVFTNDPSGETLCKVSWIGDDENKIFPIILKSEVDLGPMFGKWAWQSAEQLSLNHETLEAIAKVVELVHHDFGTGDPSRIVRLSKIRYEESARAYPAAGETPDYIEKEFVEYLLESAKNHTWTMKPLNLNNASFRICADGRMVQCIDKDWNPLIIAQAQDLEEKQEKIDEFPFPIFLSKINGEFKIVR